MLHSFHLAILNLFTLQFFYKSSTNIMKKCSSLSSFFMKEDPSFFKRKISPLNDKLWNFISNLCLHPTPLLFSMPWNKIRLLKSSAKLESQALKQNGFKTNKHSPLRIFVEKAFDTVTFKMCDAKVRYSELKYFTKIWMLENIPTSSSVIAT